MLQLMKEVVGVLPVAGYVLFHIFMSKVKDNITYSSNDPIFNLLFGICFLEA